jgi:hypothetical protein
MIEGLPHVLINYSCKFGGDSVTLDEYEHLDEAIGEAEELFEMDRLHRYVVSDPTGLYHVVTVDEYDVGTFPSCQIVFSTDPHDQ